MKKKVLAILVAAAGPWAARADVATMLKYDAVPAHAVLTFAGSFQGDFSVSVTGAVAGATLNRYSTDARGWTITAVADTGYETPTFKTCPYDDATGDNLDAAHSYTGTATVVGYNVHVYDIAAPAKRSRVQFNLDGGVGAADPKIVTYGSTYGTLPTPTRTGYTFDGWFTAAEGGVQVTESTRVTITATQNLYAHWTPIRYTAEFKANGGSGTMPPMTLTYDQNTNLAANAFTRANYTFNKWKAADGSYYVDRARVVNLASTAGAVVTFVAQWTPVSYTITFDSAGGSAVSPITKAFGASVSKPSNPTREGYVFARWSPALPATMPPRNMTVKAIWRVKSYTVTYDSAGGSAVASSTQLLGSTVKSPVPEREGYSFAGWSPALPATMPASDLAVVAQWTTNFYTITFDSAGGSAVAPITRPFGSAVAAPPAPTREGYRFDGWTPALPATMLASDLSVTARWTANSHTISFDSAGGSPVTAISQEYGTKVTPPTAPEREGYSFAGWSPALPATMPAADMSVTARWTANTYMIVFDAAGGSGAMEPMTLTYDRSARLTANAFTRTHGRFLGWKAEDGTDYLDRATVSNLTTIAGATVRFFAQWDANSFTISFDSAGGTSVPAITQAYGTAVSAPADPVRDGYTFARWEPALPEKMPPRNQTVKAVWTVNPYTISFDSAGGSEVAAITQLMGTTVKAPDDPVRAGYEFAGWAPVLPATMPASNLTATAQWTTNRYVITFDPAGGSPATSVTLAAGAAVTPPANPSRDGYTFGGWTPALPATMPASNLTMTAQWTLNTYTLAFDENGGDGGETMTNWTVAVGSKLTLPPNAFTRTGYAFDGWKGTNGVAYANCQTVTLAGKKGETVKLLAQWKPYMVTFSLSEGGFTQGSIDAMKANGSVTNDDFDVSTQRSLTALFTEGRPFGALPSATNRDEHFSFTLKSWRVMRDGVFQAVSADMTVPPLAAGWTSLGAQWTWEPSDELAATLDVTSLAVSITPNSYWTVDDQHATCGENSVLIQVNKEDYETYNPKNVSLTASLVGRGTLTFDWRMDSAKINSYTDPTKTKWENTIEKLFFFRGGTDSGSFVCGFASDSNSWLRVTDFQGTSAIEGLTSDLDPAKDGWESCKLDLEGEATTTTNIVTWQFRYERESVDNPPWPARVWIDNIKWTGTGTVEPPPVQTYAVEFDANGGDGTMSSLVVDDADGTNLTANVFTREGFTFVGWNTQSNGTGLVVADGARLALSTNATLYAQWSTNAYTLTFDSAGGSAVAPVTLEYGAAVTAPAAPVRDGYTFTNWSPALPTTMPASNVTAKACWTANPFVITFDPAGGSSVPAQTNDYGSAVTTPANPVRTGYAFARWQPALPATMPASNLTATARWTARQYTLSFNLGEGGSGLDPITQAFDTIIVVPTTPVRDGYMFGGWTPALPEKMPASNLTATAVWTPEQHSITLDPVGGSEVVPITQAYGTSVTVADPVREGYTFGGWSQPIPARMGGDLWVTAQWTVNLYTNTFDSAGGTPVAPVVAAYGAAVTAPADPVREGYSFAGWTPALPATMPASNLTMTAQWSTNAYTVTLDRADGSEPDEMTFDLGMEVVVPDPVREGYSFAGWTPALPATMPASNLTATARWTANLFVITFDSAGGSSVRAQTNACGSTVTAPADPVREGYTFDGWTPALPATMPASNLTATARWTANRYEIAFDLGDGGSGLDTITQEFGTAVVLPVTAPSREGYVFAGWSVALPTDMPASNVTAVALWTREVHSIMFDPAGGSEVPAITQEYGTRVTAPAAPVREGFAFAGWTPALPETMPANDLTTTARWTTNSYVIVFNPAGGSSVPTQTNAFGSTVTAPANPVRTGYAFAGWQPALPTTMPASNLMATARWTANRYTITFNAAGGTAVAPITQAYGTRVTAPANPVRTGYAFAGWRPALPATMPASNLTVTATWTAEVAPGPVGPTDETERKLYATVTSALVESAATYDGYLYDAHGRVAGVVQVKRAKYNVKKDMAKVTATVTLAGSRKKTYGGGEWHLDSEEVVLTSRSDARALRVVLGARGLAGTYGDDYHIDGALNPFTSKDPAVKEDGAAVLADIASKGGAFVLAVPSDMGWGGITVTVKSRGKASVTGTLADGTRVNVSSQLLIGEEACCIPVVSPKFANPAFAVWLTRRGVPDIAVGLDGAEFAAVGAGLSVGAEFNVDEAALAATLGDGLLTDYLPNGFSVTAVGAKWLVEDGAKAGQVKMDRQTGELTATSANWAALKLTYKAKTGQFSGSFKAYVLANGRLKSTMVKVIGVLVDGSGYGTATVAKRTAAVTVAPKNN